MKTAICRHIKTNGRRCKSPSLGLSAFCYFHSRLHQTHKRFRHNDATRGYLIPGQHIELAALEDRESVQVALSVVINALATGNLDTRRATALLYGLQLASNNAARLDTKPYAPNIVRDVESGPDGLDLAQPGATVEISEDYDPKADLALDDDEKEDEEEQELARSTGYGWSWHTSTHSAATSSAIREGAIRTALWIEPAAGTTSSNALREMSQ